MGSRLKAAGLAAAALAAIAGAGVFAQNAGVETRPPITPYKPAFPGQTRAPEQKLNVAFDQVTVAEGLNNPWAIAFLPDRRIILTEKGGGIRIIGADGKVSEPVTGGPTVVTRGQGGLLDVALDPAFATNRLVYFSYSEGQADGTNNTAVARGRLVDGPAPRIEGLQAIYHQQPSWNSSLHFGSRLVFARDGKLFITQGERSNDPPRDQAQDLNSLLGKIVRINPDGSIPSDNPYVGQAGKRPEIWSYGHRNVQAAALHPQTGELWEVEFGPQGGDEVNIARKGKNYGWPVITYGVNYGPARTPIEGGLQVQEGMEQPLYYWDPVIAPSGMIWYTGNLFPAWRGSMFVSGLAPQGLPGGYVARLTWNGERVTGEERLALPPTRFRDIRQGPDGAIYLLQSGAGGKLTKLVPR
jgi:glucose/arabinose dehydrogenase